MLFSAGISRRSQLLLRWCGHRKCHTPLAHEILDSGRRHITLEEVDDFLLGKRLGGPLGAGSAGEIGGGYSENADDEDGLPQGAA
jgi:hypothetical protein